MANNSISRLSLKLLKTSLAKDGEVLLSQDDYKDSISKLEEKLRIEVDGFFRDIRECIPNDFGFTCAFESSGVRVAVEFVDGNTHADAGGGFFTSRKSLLGKVKEIDWDGMRAELIERCGLFEGMVSEANDRPVNIPSSSAAAKKYADELEVVLEDLKKEPCSFCLVTWREDEGVSAKKWKTRYDLVGDIADSMTTAYDILAVVENGTEWTFDAIETAKLEAVEGLGPISRAKAEGRFFG